MGHDRGEQVSKCFVKINQHQREDQQRVGEDAELGPEVKTRSTNYRPRPEDGALKSSMIWLDKQAVDLYSRAKARFGFSDELASKILGFLSRKR